MRFSQELRYDAAPDKVLEMLSNPAFRERVCAAANAVRRDVSVEGAGAGMRVVVDQTQRARNIPSFATKLVGEQLQIVQRETWNSPSGAALDIEIPGKPGTLHGTIALKADGAGTIQSITGDLRVRLPLVGGRLESLVGDLLHAAFENENRVGRAWLAGDR